MYRRSLKFGMGTHRKQRSWARVFDDGYLIPFAIDAEFCGIDLADKDWSPSDGLYERGGVVELIGLATGQVGLPTIGVFGLITKLD